MPFTEAVREIFEDEVVNFGNGAELVGTYCAHGAPKTELWPAEPARPSELSASRMLRNGGPEAAGGAQRPPQTMAESYGNLRQTVVSLAS